MPDNQIQQQFRLDGKVAIVTGGAMGMGKSIAQTMCGAGASVIIADIDMETANETAEEIKAAGGKVAAVRTDLTIVADAPKLVEATVKEFGRLDIMVNNAGYMQIMPFLDVTEALYDRTLNINLKGMFFYSQAAAKQMISQGEGGRIINTASLAALLPSPPMAHYAASKGGVVSLTKAMARELVAHDILVNTVIPGGVVTPGAVGTTIEVSKVYPQLPKEVEDALTNMMVRMPLGRVAEPEEIADVVLFLASPASKYMVGSVVVADGGVLLT